MSITVSELFKIPIIYGMDLAKDGRLLAYSTNPTGIPHLYVLPTKPNSTPTQITSGDDGVYFCALAPDGDKLVYLQDKDGNELYHLFLVNIEGKEVKRITETPYRTWGVDWHPGGKEVTRSAITKKSCLLEAYNLETGEIYLLMDTPTTITDVKYSHNGKWLACTAYGGGKDPKNMQILVMNREDPRDIITYSIRDGSKEMLPMWSPTDEKLAFITDAYGRNQVVIQKFQGDEQILLTLKEGEEVDECRVYWNPEGDKVYYLVSKHSQNALYEHSLHNKKRDVLPFPKGTISQFNMSEDGKTIVASHSSMASPPCIYLHQVGSTSTVPVTTTDYKINLTQLAQPKSVWYKSFDGLDVHGWYLPPKYGNPPYPAVIWVHGGPWWQVFDSWNPYLQAMSQNGFTVFAPNFRGSTGYGTEFRNLNISDPGGGDLEDIVYAAEWIRQQMDIDRSKIAIVGGSYGGYMALISLTKKPDIFSAGVAIVPVTDWLEDYARSDIAFRKFNEELFGGSPEQKEQLYRDRSPITYATKIKAPVLIIHGRHDSRCPIQPVEKFVEKLKEMGHSYEFIIEEKEGHGFARVSAQIREVTTIIEYLKKTFTIS